MYKRSTRLLASAAASAGLAFGGLSLAAPAAEAATPAASASYTCTTPLPIPGLSSFQVPATFSLENLPDVLTANLPIPAGVPLVGQLDFSATGLLPSVILALQSAVNLVVGNIPGAGAATAPLDGLFTQLTGAVATVTSQLGAFTPGAGALPIPIPTSFDFAPIAGLLAGLGVHCTLNPGSVKQPAGGAGSAGGGAVTVQKQGAKIRAHTKKVIKAGQRSVVNVKVKTTAGQKGVGSIVVKARGHKAMSKALKNGKVRFVLKGLKVGANKIKISFLGNGYTNAAKKKVTVRVVH
jgi:hypothetical protein